MQTPQPDLLELIPLGYAMLDATTGDWGQSAPALDVRPEWVSREVGEYYKQWQKLPRLEDRQEWVFTHYQNNEVIFRAFDAAKSGIMSPRDAVNELRQRWFNAKEQDYLHRFMTGDANHKARILNEMQSFYGVKEGRALSIDISNPPEKDLPCLLYNGVGFLFRNDVTAVKAKAKSGKSHLGIIWAAALISNEPVLGFQRPDMSKPLRVLFVDTEQSLYTSYLLAVKILTLADKYDPDDPKNYEALQVENLRTMATAERLPYLRGLIATGKYDVLILDGIKDLTRDINDNIEADSILQGLTSLCSSYNLAMMTVLHENPGKDNDKMRGHIGTELLNKAHDIFEIVRDGDVFNIYHTDSRGKSIQDWAFKFNEFDELEATEPTKSRQSAMEQGPGLGPQREERERKSWGILVDAFENKSMSYTKEELVAALARRSNIAETTAKRRVDFFYRKNFLGIMGGSPGDKGARYYIKPDKLTEYNIAMEQKRLEEEAGMTGQIPPPEEGPLPF